MALDRQDLQIADEKKISGFADDGESASPTTDALSLNEVRWTAEEEKRLVRKIDFLVLPLLISAFFALQLDRGMSIDVENKNDTDWINDCLRQHWQCTHRLFHGGCWHYSRTIQYRTTIAVPRNCGMGTLMSTTLLWTLRFSALSVSGNYGLYSDVEIGNSK